jgi:hypothetical protein
MTLLAATAFVWVFILLPILIVWVIGVVDILRRKLPPQKKAGWILLVLILPVVGTLVYFVLRKPTDEEIRLAQHARAARGGERPRRPSPPM